MRATVYPTARPRAVAQQLPEPTQAAPSGIHYPVASDFKERMQIIERQVKERLLANPSSTVWRAQHMLIECLKGRLKVTDLYSWTNVR